MTITRSTPVAELPAVLRAEEVASFLGVSKATIYALIANGELEALRVGRLVRVTQETLLAFIGVERVTR
jgi:excisionase family DNA binding protein